MSEISDWDEAAKSLMSVNLDNAEASMPSLSQETELSSPLKDSLAFRNGVLTSPYEYGKENRTYNKIYPNRVYTSWYRRYVTKLPEGQQLDFQPYEEVQKVDEDIALRYFYGDERHIRLIMDGLQNRDVVEKRRIALQKYIHVKENEEREQAQAMQEQKQTGQSRYKAIMRALKTREVAAFGASVTEKKVTAPIVNFLTKMQIKKRRQLHEVTIKPNSKWLIFKLSTITEKIRKMYRNLCQQQIIARFRKVIRLVVSAMCFIDTIRIISGSTKQILKEIENFMEVQTRRSRNLAGGKKVFDYSKYNISKEIHIPFEIVLTLSQPWYTRREKEIDAVVEVLQSYKSFVQYPPVFQRRLATLAWYIETQADKYIIRERHIACDFYILLKGKAKVVKLVGDPCVKRKGKLQVIRYIKKSEAFGDESMSDPECEREYSVISSEPCALLAISTYDYSTMIHVKKDNEVAPEHILFLSNLKFFEDFPKQKLMEEGDENITIHYFRSESVVAKNLKEANYMFVVINGACRLLSEIVPEKTPSMTQRKNREDSLEVRSNAGSDATKETASMDTVQTGELKGVTQSDEQLNTLDAAFENILTGGAKRRRQELLDTKWMNQQVLAQKKKQETLIEVHRAAIALEVAHFQAKARRILKTLPKSIWENVAKESNSITQSQLRLSFSSKRLDHPIDTNLIQVYAPNSESSDDEIQEFYNNLDMAIKQCKPCEVNFVLGDLNVKVGTEQDKKSIVSSPHFAPPVVNVQEHLTSVEECKPTLDTPDTPSQAVREGDESNDIQNASNLALSLAAEEAEMKSSAEEFMKSTESETERNSEAAVEDLTIPTPSCTTTYMPQTAKNEMKAELIPDPSVSTVEIMEDTEVMKKKRSCYIRRPETDHHRLFSKWKLVRSMNRGDYTGQEWLDFNNGPYEPPGEVWSLVSDGCELIMVKKSFLIKHMRREW